MYEATFTVLAFVAGRSAIVWEFVYHWLMQFRWEKDWPTLFGLITIVNRRDPRVDPARRRDGSRRDRQEHPDRPVRSWHFITTWLVMFLFVNGPMRVPFIRWRFRGGRLI